MDGRTPQASRKPGILAARSVPASRPVAAALLAARPPSPLLFDPCHPGVVLRALALVLAPTALMALFGAQGPVHWLMYFSMLTVLVLPATLAWLLLCCALRGWLQQQAASVQWSLAVLLGGLCGLLACLLCLLLIPGAPAPAAWLASGLSGALAAVLLTHMLVLRQRASQPAAAVARLAELQARIRPHFLFNTLNSAIALVRQDPARAECMLEDLSDLFHHVLKDGTGSSDLGREIEVARQYLRIESARFAQRLQVFWSIDHEALCASVPPLLLQPLLENAVLHGIEPAAAGGEIHVLVRRRGPRVLVRISNTLPDTGAHHPARQQRGNGMALQNVRERLHLMHDMNADFQCRARAHRYEVAITLPARPLPDCSGAAGRAFSSGS